MEEEIEKSPEIVNILQCIVEYPKEMDPVRRSEYFLVIQKHTERALEHLSKANVVL
jgi:hypothetical protein